MPEIEVNAQAKEPTFEQVGERHRVERGPRVLEAVATPELLDNEVTASHYQVGRFDAVGKRIKLGEKMTYADWKNREAYVWKIYELQTVETKDGPVEKYIKIEEADTKEDAMRQARSFALQARKK